MWNTIHHCVEIDFKETDAQSSHLWIKIRKTHGALKIQIYVTFHIVWRAKQWKVTWNWTMCICYTQCVTVSKVKSVVLNILFFPLHFSAFVSFQFFLSFSLQYPKGYKNAFLDVFYSISSELSTTPSVCLSACLPVGTLVGRSRWSARLSSTHQSPCQYMMYAYLHIKKIRLLYVQKQEELYLLNETYIVCWQLTYLHVQAIEA